MMLAEELMEQAREKGMTRGTWGFGGWETTAAELWPAVPEAETQRDSTGLDESAYRLSGYAVAERVLARERRPERREGLGAMLAFAVPAVETMPPKMKPGKSGQVLRPKKSGASMARANEMLDMTRMIGRLLPRTLGGWPM